MFDEIAGLPAHPLITHAAVVLTPLLALVALAYAALPRLRGRLDWAAAGLAVVTPVAVLAARQSGEAFKERLFQGGLPEGELGQKIAEHEDLGMPLLWVSAGLALCTLALVLLTARPAAEPPSGARAAVVVVLRVLVGLIALLALFYVVRAGHTGAEAVWGG